jgi:hypothetical protein
MERMHQSTKQKLRTNHRTIPRVKKMTKEDYELCKEACKHDGPECYCPPDHEFHLGVANTPAWLRRYFFAKGFQEAQKELEDELAKHHILTGEAAENFLKEMENKEASPEQQKFLDECSEMFKKSRSTPLRGDK